MTEQEKLMYDFLARVSKTDAPIVFKGGLITKLILSENGFTDVQRSTKDVDANWIGSPPSMQEMVHTISEALGELQETFEVIASREYKEKTSAGISIVDKKTGDRLISMDIDIKPLIGIKTYYFGEASIRGVLANEILADKICAISGDSVYKHRAKDLIDVYSLSHCSAINAKEIYDTCIKSNRTISTFEAFYNRYDDVKHAYDKLRGVEGKPDFDRLYKYLSAFIKPFALKKFENISWNAHRWNWELPENTIDIKTTISEILQTSTTPKSAESRSQEPFYFGKKAILGHKPTSKRQEPESSRDKSKQSHRNNNNIE